MIKIITLSFLLVNLSCLKAKLPDLTKICSESGSCDMAVKTNGRGSTFTNFKVASECINCLEANIGNSEPTISCKVSGCYSDGTDYEFASFSKNSPTSIIEKPICSNPTAKIVEKLTISCTIEHNKKERMEINNLKLKAAPSTLLDRERLCMKLKFNSNYLTDEQTGETRNTYKIEVSPDLESTCKEDATANMVVFEFSK